jgi:hypothetical protein
MPQKKVNKPIILPTTKRQREMVMQMSQNMKKFLEKAK